MTTLAAVGIIALFLFLAFLPRILGGITYGAFRGTRDRRRSQQYPQYQAPQYPLVPNGQPPSWPQPYRTQTYNPPQHYVAPQDAVNTWLSSPQQYPTHPPVAPPVSVVKAETPAQFKRRTTL